MNHGALTLKNYMLNTLLELLSIPLAGKLARSRNKFVLLFTSRTKMLEEKRIELLKSFGELTPEGELQIGEDGHYKLKDKAGFETAFKNLTDEQFEMPCVAESVIDFRNMHQVLDTLETPMTVATTTVYEEIMTAFETWVESQKNNG